MTTAHPSGEIDKPSVQLIPDTVMLLGATSEIGLAMVDRYLARAQAESRTIRVLAGIRPDSTNRDDAITHLESKGAVVEVFDFDATKPADHDRVIGEVFAKHRVDVAIIAFGVLFDESTASHSDLVAMLQTNMVGAISAGSVVASGMKTQDVVDGCRGRIVAISSMAAEKLRAKNLVYGTSKAGADQYFGALAEILAADNVVVTVARPGQVKTKMVKGIQRVPLRISPARAGREIVEAVDRGKTLVRTPVIFTPMMALYKRLPAAVRQILPV